MDISSALFVIAVMYCVLYFFDTFFKTCAHYPYIQFLKGTGLEVKFFHIRLTTTAFNRILVRWGSNNTRFLNWWFSCGVHISLLLLPLSICLVLYAAVRNFISDNTSKYAIEIEPIIPGVNLPASELGYYSAALIISSIFHEAGHALASIKEDVHLINIGISIFFVLPVAYVNINSEKLKSLNRWRALKILCAGIWHNVVLALLTYLMYCSLPYIFSLFFYTNNGVYISDVFRTSPLYGAKGLHVGDVITKISDCPVRNDIQWIDCLHGMLTKKPGYCISADLVHALDESMPLQHISNDVYDCCSRDKTESVCFEFLDNKDGILELPPHVCLPARSVVENSHFFCDSNEKSCPNDLHCFRPLLHNNTNLFKIKRIAKADVIYIGHSSDFVHSLHVSPYVPKYIFNSSYIPDVISKLQLYIATFSIGLALVNVIPAFFMDGQHITNAIVQILLSKHHVSTQILNLITVILCFSGTFLIVVLGLQTIWNKYLS